MLFYNNQLLGATSLPFISLFRYIFHCSIKPLYDWHIKSEVIFLRWLISVLTFSAISLVNSVLICVVCLKPKIVRKCQLQFKTNIDTRMCDESHISLSGRVTTDCILRPCRPLSASLHEMESGVTKKDRWDQSIVE